MSEIPQASTESTNITLYIRDYRQLVSLDPLEKWAWLCSLEKQATVEYFQRRKPEWVSSLSPKT